MTLAEQKRIIDSQVPDRDLVGRLLAELVSAFPPHVRVGIEIETIDITAYLDRKPSALRSTTRMTTEVRTSFPNDPDPSWETVEWEMNTGPLYPTRVKVDERA